MELFKYVIPERVDILQNCQIRFTQPSEFNDPWEALPNLEAILNFEAREDLLTEVFNEMENGKYNKIVQDVIEEMQKKYNRKLTPEEIEMTYTALQTQAIPQTEQEVKYMGHSILGLKYGETKESLIKTNFEIFNKKIGILSLSERHDSLLMWGHYANSYRGFVIGFNSEHDFFNQTTSVEDSFRKVKALKYSKLRPIFPGFSKGAKENELLDFFSIALFTKSVVWEYEREWRMVQNLDKADSQLYFTPPVYLFKFPPECITSVFIGSRSSDETKNSLREVLVEPRFSHIAVFNTVQDKKEYKLNFIPNQ